MYFYTVFAYLVVGVLSMLALMKARDDTSFFINDSRGKLDFDWVVFFVIVFLLSPLSLPIGVFLAVIYYIAKFIYYRFFKR